MITGAEEVTDLLGAIAKLYLSMPSKLVRYIFINGLPGFVSREPDGLQTTALLIDQGRVKAVYVMRNPDKLRHLEGSIN